MVQPQVLKPPGGASAAIRVWGVLGFGVYFQLGELGFRIWGFVGVWGLGFVTTSSP